MNSSIYVELCFNPTPVAVLFSIRHVSLLPIDVFMLFYLETNSFDTEFTAITSIGEQPAVLVATGAIFLVIGSFCLTG